MEAERSGRKRKWLREKLYKGRGKNGYDRDVSSSRNASKVSVIVDAQSAPEASSKQDTEPPSTPLKTTDEQMDQPSVTDISSELWTRAYDRLKSGEETATLVEAYEGVLFGIIQNDADLDDSEEGKEKDSVSISTTTPNDAEKIDNPLQTSGGSGRIDIMEQATRVALARAKKHKSVHEAVKDTAEFIKEIESTASSMLTAYPPAAMAWSGICMILPILASPSVQRLEMCAGLEHVMDKLEWYMVLARVAFRGNWNADPASAQMLELTKNKVVELYAALLEYEMQCVCECFKTSRFVRSMRVLLTIDDWKERIQTVKDKETEIKDQLKQHKMVQNTDTLDNISKNTSHLSAMLQEMRVMRASHDAERAEELRRHRFTVISKLSTNDTSKYDARLNSVPDRIEGTCEWFVHHVHFRHWLESCQSSLLLVTADAGCGKSVLSRYLVKTVLPDRLLESGVNAVIAYFFFSEGAETSLARALCAIVHQLLCSCEKLADLVEGDISKAGEALIGNWSRLWDIFQKCVTSETAPDVICVIDALDECEPSDVRTLIGNSQTLVESLSTNKKGSLKVVMTTRGYPGIVERFRFRQDSSSIRLAGENSEEIAQIQDEIAIVINHKLGKLAEAKNLKTERVNKLRSLLAKQGGNQRTYLWVHLIFAVLENNNRNVETEWARRINTLPDTVNEAYEKLLGAIPDDDLARVRVLLHLMFVAYKPLRIVDAAVLLNSRETYEASTDNSEQEIGVLEVGSADSFRGWVLSTCHCFVTVYGNTLYFIHQTAREFLSRADRLEANLGKFENSISEREAHCIMSESCLAHWAYDATATLDIPDLPKEEIHQRYSPRYWADHFSSSQVFTNVDGALAVNDIHDRFWPAYERLWVNRRPSDEDYLHSKKWLVASWFNSENNNKYSWSTGLTRFMANYGHYRPLHCILNQVDTEQMQSEDAKACLESAIVGGHFDCLQLLISSGFESNFQSFFTEEYNALLLAIDNFLPEMVRYILEYNTGRRKDGAWKADIVNLGREHTPLHYAIQHSRKYSGTHILDIIKLLLNYGAKTDCRDEDNNTPLHLACSTTNHHSAAIVKCLLNHGAGVDDRNWRSITPLQVACTSPDRYNIKVVNTLLEHGAEVHSRDNDNRTPLHRIYFCITRESATVVKCLLDHGAGVNDRCAGGFTALHFACLSDEPDAMEVAQVLLDNGAGINIQIDLGWTPLHVACYKADVGMVSLLLKAGEPTHPT